MADSKMTERLRRIEAVIAGKEQVSQKQASLLLLDLMYSMYSEIAPQLPQIERNKIEIERLKVKVAMGIGLTVVVAIAGGLIAVFGG